jgi:hypothetical protein
MPPVLHYLEKRKERIIFITGLRNKPQGCGASVESAAGPFITKEENTAKRDKIKYNVKGLCECTIALTQSCSVLCQNL